jgi:tyrosyl-tRNA synthetase
VLLADIHAYLNEKGNFEQIRKTAKYNKRCFAAAGLSEATEFILGVFFSNGARIYGERVKACDGNDGKESEEEHG